MLQPWPHQVRTDALVRDAYRQGRSSILIVAPTGSGKTFMASRFALGGITKGSRVLWLAHREELIDQAALALRDVGCSPSIIAPWAPREDNALQVGSIQTLLARSELPEADILVLDEAHHHVSPEWTQIATHYRDRQTLILGLTATPQRGDGVALGNVFDSMVVSCQPRELIASGHLVKCLVKRPTKRTKALAEHPIEALRTIAADRQRVIIFGTSVRHATNLAHEANAMGIAAASVDGKMSRDRRQGVIAAFRRGDVRVLTNMHVLTEGFDCRETDCVILARGFSSEGAMMQACGRGLRASPGKVDCLILDLRGCTLDLGLPDDDRRFSLEGRAIQDGENLEAITQCPECGYLWRACEFKDATCPECGYVRPGKEDPKVRKQRLLDANAEDSHEDKITYLSHLVRTALILKKKIGYAKILFVQYYTDPRLYQGGRGDKRTWRWPMRHELAESGYHDAESLLHDLWMVRQVRGSNLTLDIRGAWRVEDVKALVQLCREAIASGNAERELDGQRVRVTVASTSSSAMQETGT
jgi:superfamily II DNA or RNA helicase